MPPAQKPRLFFLGPMNYALFHQYRDWNNATETELATWRHFKRDSEGDKPVLNLDLTSF